jgi:hypothetical protein
LDNKKVTVSMYGMKVENRCFWGNYKSSLHE